MDNRVEIAAATRQIARALEALADAIVDGSDRQPESVRARALLREWGDRGLDRRQASALFRKHGFAPQTAGGWARSDWIATRDGRRYVTESSRRWLAGEEDDAHV